MAKMDFKKQMVPLYSPKGKEIQVLDVPEMDFIAVDGVGDPNKSPYFEAAETLFSIAYTIKFMVRKETGIDYGVMPLESLWCADNMADFAEGKRDNWKWTALIMQPECVTETFFRSAVEKLKTGRNPPALAKARFEAFREGLCAQVMYRGPYSEEGPVITGIHEFVANYGYKLRGKHHEIYLNDPHRSRPENLKTILRQPVEKI
jgi:hypothetical protein